MFETFIVVLLFLSGAANRAAEAVKSVIAARFPTLSAEVVSFVAFVTSIIAGIIGALSLNLNLFLSLPEGSYFANVPPLAGVVLTGVVAGLGSEGIHVILDLLYGKRDELVTRAEKNLAQAEATAPEAETVVKSAASNTAKW